MDIDLAHIGVRRVLCLGKTFRALLLTTEELEEEWVVVVLVVVVVTGELEDITILSQCLVVVVEEVDCSCCAVVVVGGDGGVVGCSILDWFPSSIVVLHVEVVVVLGSRLSDACSWFDLWKLLNKLLSLLGVFTVLVLLLVTIIVDASLLLLTATISLQILLFRFLFIQLLQLEHLFRSLLVADLCGFHSSSDRQEQEEENWREIKRFFSCFFIHSIDFFCLFLE